MRARRCAVAFSLLLAGLPSSFRTAAAQDASAQTIEIRLSRNVFRIPDTYFLPRFRGHLRSPLERHTIYLGFRFPDVSPLADDYDEHLGASTPEAFARWNGTGQFAIDIVLTSPHVRSRNRWSGNFADGAPPNDEITRFVDAGLEGRKIGSYSIDGDTRYVEVFRSTDGAHYFRCENTLRRVARSCGTQLYRNQELRIEILFLEAALPHWKEIISKAAEFVDRWRVNPAAR